MLTRLPGSAFELGQPQFSADLLGAAASVDVWGVVEDVVDGDTLVVRSAGRRVNTRLLGIDAPELHFHGFYQSPWAEAAHRQLRQLAPRGARVRLVTDRQVFDQYGRLLAYVFRGGRNLNLDLVRSGWAVSYQIYPNLSLFRVIQAATAAAQAARRGIFDARRPLDLLPYEFRMRVEHRDPTRFCGDSQSRRYVTPAAYARVPLARRVFFPTEADARTFGYAPAMAQVVAAPSGLPYELGLRVPEPVGAATVMGGPVTADGR